MLCGTMCKVEPILVQNVNNNCTGRFFQVTELTHFLKITQLRKYCNVLPTSIFCVLVYLKKWQILPSWRYYSTIQLGIPLCIWGVPLIQMDENSRWEMLYTLLKLSNLVWLVLAFPECLQPITAAALCTVAINVFSRASCI